MSEFTEEQISSILDSYKNKREKEKERYEKIKHTPEFKEKNRQRARKYYENNKEKVNNKYQQDPEFIRSRNSYNYYKKTNSLEKFIQKFPTRYQLLKDRGYLKDIKPSSSTSNETDSSVAEPSSSL